MEGNLLELANSKDTDDASSNGCHQDDIHNDSLTPVRDFTQYEDVDDGTIPCEHPDPENDLRQSGLLNAYSPDTDQRTEEPDLSLFNACGSEVGYDDWTSSRHSTHSEAENSSPELYLDTVSDIDNRDFYAKVPDESIESAVTDKCALSGSLLSLTEGADTPLDTELVNSYENSHAAEWDFTEEGLEIAITEGYRQLELEGLSISDEEPVTGEDSLSGSLPIAVAGTSATDDSLVLEADRSATESLCTSLSTSPSSSPLPPSHVPPGFSMATAATGIPLRQTAAGAGHTCFVRVHPMQVAAAVAAQRSRAAAMAQQQAQMAAVMQQRTAAVARQQAAAAAAVQQQRTRVALMHQQAVRNRFLGAPVLVRQPFAPVPRVVAPVRVQMRLRRSVVMTEEYSLNNP